MQFADNKGTDQTVHKCRLLSESLLFTYGINEPRCEKTGLRDFPPGPTQTRLCSHRRWLEA